MIEGFVAVGVIGGIEKHLRPALLEIIYRQSMNGARLLTS